jgi:hypothetical protein
MQHFRKEYNSHFVVYYPLFLYVYNLHGKIKLTVIQEINQPSQLQLGHCDIITLPAACF